MPLSDRGGWREDEALIGTEHDALADHPAKVWPAAEWDQPAVLCGVCGGELSVREYMGCGNRCPACGAAFNPGCRLHYHLYFEG